MFEILSAGLVLGFSAGISPGPTLALMLRETLARGWRAGWTVAMAPLVADLPVVLASLFLVGLLPAWAVTALSIGGGLFVVWMGVEGLRAAPPEPGSAGGGSLWRAVFTNWLNPHPWIFWFTVGAPQVIDAWQRGGIWWPALFLLAFYALLVGIKGGLATLVHRSRGLLQGRAYGLALRASGALLIGMGLLLVAEGLARA